MPKDIRHNGVAVGSNMTRQQKITAEGPEVDDVGMPVMIEILELIFVDPRTGDTDIFPLTEQGVAAVKQAIEPRSGIVVAKPGMIPNI